MLNLADGKIMDELRGEDESAYRPAEDIVTERQRKINRTRFTSYQTYMLNEAFSSSPYLDSADCQSLSRQLGISTRSIQMWFKNKRYKIRTQARQYEVLSQSPWQLGIPRLAQPYQLALQSQRASPFSGAHQPMQSALARGGLALGAVHYQQINPMHLSASSVYSLPRPVHTGQLALHRDGIPVYCHMTNQCNECCRSCSPGLSYDGTDPGSPQGAHKHFN